MKNYKRKRSQRCVGKWEGNSLIYSFRTYVERGMNRKNRECSIDKSSSLRWCQQQRRLVGSREHHRQVCCEESQRAFSLWSAQLQLTWFGHWPVEAGAEMINVLHVTLKPAEVSLLPLALWCRLSFWLAHYYIGTPRLIEPWRTRHTYGLQPVYWNRSACAPESCAWAGFHLTCFLSHACWRLCGKIKYQFFSEQQVIWRRQDFRSGE